MEFDFNKYTFQELIELKNLIQSYLNNTSDGFTYICDVRSYGRTWLERPCNIYSLNELCDMYDGDSGIVDVYTNNPKLGDDFRNYGSVKIIKSETDYLKWKMYNEYKNIITNAEKDLYEYIEDQQKPFLHRKFMFGPTYTEEEIKELKITMSQLPIDFEEPIDYYSGE